MKQFVKTLFSFRFFTTAPADEDMTDSGRHIPGAGWKIGRMETPMEGEVEHSMTFTVWGKQCKKQTRYEYTVLHSNLNYFSLALTWFPPPGCRSVNTPLLHSTPGAREELSQPSCEKAKPKKGSSDDRKN